MLIEAEEQKSASDSYLLINLSFGFDPTQPQGSIRDLSHFFTHP